MSGARSLTGKLTAKAYSYTDNVSRTITWTQWTQEGNYNCTYRVPVMGADPYYVQPLSFTLDGSVASQYNYNDMRFEVDVYDNSDTLVWSSASGNRWGDTVTSSTLSPELYLDTDIAYRVLFRVSRSSGYCMRERLGDVAVSINCEYNDNEEPVETGAPPFELPNDWVNNTTNTIADKFVPFETVTTPIDPDDTGDTVDQFKEFLEGVQEYETLATVFMGYVSELLRLKGITAFLCFSICCCTMIAIFELSGG